MKRYTDKQRLDWILRQVGWFELADGYRIQIPIIELDAKTMMTYRQAIDAAMRKQSSGPGEKI